MGVGPLVKSQNTLKELHLHVYKVEPQRWFLFSATIMAQTLCFKKKLLFLFFPLSMLFTMLEMSC